MLGVPLTGDDATGALLRAVAGLDVARGVLSVSASAVDHTLCALVRITDPRDGVAGQAAERLVADGLATPLPPGAQDEGWSPRCRSAAVWARSPTWSRRCDGERAKRANQCHSTSGQPTERSEGEW